MAKYLRYMGEFLSRAAVTWRVEILQEAESEFASVGPLTFEAEEPLMIEWKHTGREDTLCGSTATVRIESPGDRTYEDLYTIEVGAIRMDVYRNGALYWSGLLDSEFYEEPYEKAANYAVQLTFSDFGILDRLKYNLAGMQALYAIVSDALGRSGISYTGIDQTLISSSIGSAKLTLGSLCVRSDNFYDEDGAASTLKETIEGILQPLGLRMVQRLGRIYVYDLNGLYTLAPQKQITWDGDSSTMGVDKVANNVKITWSTYAQGGNQAPEECWTEEVDRTLINLGAGYKTSGSCHYLSYHYSTNILDWQDTTDAGFTLWLSRLGRNIELKDSSVMFFKIVEQNDGAESEGVAVGWSGFAADQSRPTEVFLLCEKYGHRNTGALGGTLAACTGKLFKGAEVQLPPVDDASGLTLRITLSMLMDCRFNPFEEAGHLRTREDQETEAKWYEKWNKYGNFVYVPVTVKFRPEDSDTVYCWTNRTVVGKYHNIRPVSTLKETYGVWQQYSAADDENPDVWGYLCYYDSEDRVDTSGVLGWKKNRPAINPHSNSLTTILRKAGEGQYIPYPNFGSKGGRLWVEVRKGSWMICNEDSDLPSAGDTPNPKGLWSKIRFILFQLPEIEIMNGRQFDKAIDTDDVEYSAEINAAAAEGIEISSICGTAEGGVPTARGAYFNASTGKQITDITRAGRTSQVEELLIGTLYSQYAQRRTTLSGEVALLTDGVTAYTEQNQSGKLFLLRSDLQNTIEDTSEVDIAELRPDEYDKAYGGK